MMLRRSNRIFLLALCVLLLAVVARAQDPEPEPTSALPGPTTPAEPIETTPASPPPVVTTPSTPPPPVITTSPVVTPPTTPADPPVTTTTRPVTPGTTASTTITSTRTGSLSNGVPTGIPTGTGNNPSPSGGLNQDDPAAQKFSGMSKGVKIALIVVGSTVGAIFVGALLLRRFAVPASKTFKARRNAFASNDTLHHDDVENYPAHSTVSHGAMPSMASTEVARTVMPATESTVAHPPVLAVTSEPMYSTGARSVAPEGQHGYVTAGRMTAIAPEGAYAGYPAQYYQPQYQYQYYPAQYYPYPPQPYASGYPQDVSQEYPPQQYPQGYMPQGPYMGEPYQLVYAPPESASGDGSSTR
ncbi:hypothetical protein BC832DRAFT_538400 [Gaertneriomyces semiglobifer]|nr:hypothetical protein BC832DRAFT_538400 [Gaertneriomyces semiglobifer]